MKTFPVLLFATTISTASLLLPGCSKPDETSVVIDKTNADAKTVADNAKATAVDSWDSVKGYTYEKRTEFSAGIGRMASRLDDKTRDLKDRSTTDYDAARADLKSKLTDLGNATAATWDEAKQKTADSWKHVQAAYDKMTSSPAS
jgi:hypothetical protein